MLCTLELGDGVVDFIGLDEELKQSGDSKSERKKEEKSLSDSAHIIYNSNIFKRYLSYFLNMHFLTGPQLLLCFPFITHGCIRSHLAHLCGGGDCGLWCGFLLAPTSDLALHQEEVYSLLSLYRCTCSACGGPQCSSKAENI